ncbi:MAG: 1-(5-phosphoribosyl)-5-((5-phosphoribosylamino)methylideneamino)imidazole-4-carboxamide isomerase, partial [Clostridiales bacterium]|nr:1-(5-phosphoribosyl)-5-((5-phosphoribosylamino)methylideneamino)imidazole-4-carboxamide isomerase [Clostridiales bacterium]
MLIFPAIDILNGRVVRLTEGDYGRVTEYPVDPLDAARAFRGQGATHLHVVDLDAARTGSQQNLSVVARLAEEVGLFVEVGGGCRDMASIERYLSAGAGRAIIGSAAVTDRALVGRAAAAFPGKIAVGVDARDGKVAIHGWREVTDVDALAFLASLPDEGVDVAIYTDISRDGRLEGANLDAYREAAAIERLRIIASGGVSSEDDVAALKK